MFLQLILQILWVTMDWARASAPITVTPSNTATAGVCLPTAGAEEFGDMYFLTYSIIMLIRSWKLL